MSLCVVVVLLAASRGARACIRHYPAVDVRVPEEMPTCGAPVEILWVEQLLDVSNLSSCGGDASIVLHLGCADCLVRARVFNAEGWLRDWGAVFQVEDHELRLPRTDDDLARLVVSRIDPVNKCISAPRSFDLSKVPVVEVNHEPAIEAGFARRAAYARVEESQAARETRERWFAGGACCAALVLVLLFARRRLARR